MPDLTKRQVLQKGRRHAADAGAVGFKDRKRLQGEWDAFLRTRLLHVRVQEGRWVKEKVVENRRKRFRWPMTGALQALGDRLQLFSNQQTKTLCHTLPLLPVSYAILMRMPPGLFLGAC
jgi:hypothetical protein